MIERLCQLHTLSATRIRDYLQAWQHQPERFNSSQPPSQSAKTLTNSALTPYSQLTRPIKGGVDV